MVNWAIAVGINKYSHSEHLNYAEQDALAMHDWFKHEAKFKKVFLFTEHSESIPAKDKNNKDTFILTQPTYGHLRTFLRAQFEKPFLKSGDNLWFFFAGHARLGKDGQYLMLLDSDPDDIEATGISVNFVTERLRRCGADNIVLFLDACCNDGSRSGSSIKDEHKGIITFYSCEWGKKSYEIDQFNHGSFTAALLEGLRIQGIGNCATVERLDRYLRHRVPEITRQYKKVEQNPYVKVEPSYKNYLILLENFADIKDIEPLKFQASIAENKGDLQLAKQLWIRVLAISRADLDAIEGIERIARKTANQSPDFSHISSAISVSGSRSNSELDNQTDWFEFEVVQVNIKGEIEKKEKQKARFFSEDLGNGVTLDMVYIPGGTFTMGSPESEAGSYDRERPQHQVTIKPFFMGKYPITQAQWKAVASLPKVNIELDPDPSYFKGEDLPVECVSWYDSVEFCDRLSQKAKREYRLPAEAEWEYACRAGTTTPFHFGQTITADLANYDGNYTYGQSPKGIYREKTTPIGSFKVANAFGLFDMHANLWEWCADCWHENYQEKPKYITIWSSNDENGLRLLRGGSWGSNPRNCRSAYRGRVDAGDRDIGIGFRVVCLATWTK